jgi:hypothetical protein
MPNMHEHASSFEDKTGRSLFLTPFVAEDKFQEAVNASYSTIPQQSAF